MVPGIIMLLLMLIPAMLTALGVVREKELGSITNFYATPVDPARVPARQAAALRRHRVGQLRCCWRRCAVFRVRRPVKGSFVAFALGALLVRRHGHRLGSLISVFVRSQIAAIFATAILSLVPAINFSGV